MPGLRQELPTVPPPRRSSPQEAISKEQKREMRMPTRMDQGLAKAINSLTPEKYLPQIMARGGEHLVFEFDDPKHKNVVYKINFRQMKPFIERGVANLSDREEMEKKLRLGIESVREQVKVLRKYFGYHAVPAQHLMVRDIPISRDVIMKINPRVLREGPHVPETIPAWIAVQRRLQMSADKVVSLNGYYAESPSGGVLRPDNLDAYEMYDEAHDLLTGRAHLKEPRSKQLEIVFGIYPTLEEVWSRMGKDPASAAQLKDTAKKLVTFTNETRRVLDVAGKNNLVLLEKDGEWTLKLPDAIFPNTDISLSDAILPKTDISMKCVEEAAQKIEHGTPLSPSDLPFVLNGLNTLRYINALAVVAGIPDRVTVPALRNIPAAKWREELKKGNWF